MTHLQKNLTQTLKREAPIYQFLRYSISGMITTGFYALLYLLLAQFFFSPMKSHFIAYAYAIVFSFLLNRFWIFKGFGRRQRILRAVVKFLLVSFLGLSINSIFVWFFSGPLVQGPIWLPLIPIIILTPLLTYYINRLWTFA
jgi:putative flippase GtrA